MHTAHNVSALYVFGEQQTRDQSYGMQGRFCFMPIKALVHRDADSCPPPSCTGLQRGEVEPAVGISAFSGAADAKP